IYTLMTGCSIDGFCELLHEVSGACAQRQAQALARGGLAVAEFHALAEIARSPRPPLEDLAAHLSVSRGRLTRIIDGLVRKDLVTRRRDEADHRNVVIEITSSGKRALGRASRLRAEAGGALLDMMSEEERCCLIRSLEKLRELMGGPEQGRGAAGGRGRRSKIEPGGGSAGSRARAREE
ncbi:MAG: MarR family winged helix-turn-helix transcriptional regulator, partial [Myxococcota bacterium]